MDTKTRLEQVRAEKRPTRRGQEECARVMAEMVRTGWCKEDLDELEILFWRCRDRHGAVL